MMKSITRIGVASAGKVGGMLGILIGFIWGIGMLVYTLTEGNPDVPEGILAFAGGMIYALPVLFAGIIGFDCIIIAMLLAWFFNITARFTGGLQIRIED